MEPIFDIVKHYANFYDEAGNFHGSKRIDKHTINFRYCRRSFVFRPKHSSFTKKWRILWTEKYYHYNLDNPEPLVFNKGYKEGFEPLLTSRQFDTLIESKVMHELNKLSQSGWLEKLLTPANIIIGIVVLILVWWFNHNGGKLW